MKKINDYIDQTLLSADCTEKDILNLIDEAIKFNFYSVCINPCWVKFAKKNLKNSKVKVVTVIGFPLGCTSSAIKLDEAKKAIADGADEVDMVQNNNMLKSGNVQYLIDEERKITEYAHERGVVVKVIFETCLLSRAELRKSLDIATRVKADFAKTSTGFSTGGAKLEDIQFMKEYAEGKLKIKASGGIKNKNDAEKLIEAGADRIGTSHGIEIIKG